MRSVFQRLRERKLVQWVLAYLAASFVVFQLLDALAVPLGLAVATQRTILALVVAGFAATLVIAWYHGEIGRQRVSGPELLILATLFALAGLALALLGGEGNRSEAGATTSDSLEERDYAQALRELPGIGVLPFANRSALSEDQYFTDGFHDEILTRLQRIPGLRVVSRTSVEAYRDSPQPVREIARQLEVDYLLEGGVQRSVAWCGAVHYGSEA